MPYYLRTFVGRVLQIDDGEAGAILDARRATFARIAFEELWDMVVQNLADLERDLVTAGVDQMLFGGQSWSENQDIRTLFARRLANLLTSAKSYIEISQQHLRVVGQSNALIDMMKESLSTAYDAHFAYRFMEALRNYTQHRGIPVSSMHMDMRFIQDDAGEHLRYIAAASIDPRRLIDDPKFKASVRRELAEHSKLEVNYFARCYVEQLSDTHIKVRNAATSGTEDHQLLIQSAIDRLTDAATGDADFGAYIGERDANDKRLAEHALMVEPFHRLKALHSRNGSLHRLGERYVSGQTLGRLLR